MTKIFTNSYHDKVPEKGIIFICGYFNTKTDKEVFKMRPGNIKIIENL